MSGVLHDTGICSLTYLIKQELIRIHESSYQDMTKIIIRNLKQKSIKFSENTIKRRVYDIMNVLISSGCLKKRQYANTYFWIGFSNILPNQKEIENQIIKSRIFSKKDQLNSKIRLLIAYKQLILQNSFRTRPYSSIHMPAIAIGLLPQSDCQTDQTLPIQNSTNTEIVIKSSGRISVFSPSEIINMIPIKYSLEELFSNQPDLYNVIFRAQNLPDIN